MQKVIVMTDSVACIPANLAEEYQIKVIPAAYILYNGTTYIDGVTLSVQDAYALIKKDPDKFMTSALTPNYILDVYRELGEKGHDIFHITLSSALSAGSKTASLASEVFKKEYPDSNIRVFDSKAVAGAQGLVVLAAAQAAARGMELEQIADITEQTRQRTKGIMMLDTLRYVYRTGRMSKMASRIASLFNIKPINRLTSEGTIEFVDKVRDRKSGYQRLIDLIKEDTETDSLYFMIMHAAAPEMAEELTGLLKQQFNCLEVIISEYSPVMGYGSGPGSIFVGYCADPDLFK